MIQSQLTPQRQLTQYTSLAVNEQQLSFVCIDNPQGSAIISLFGAHLLHYQRPNETPILWLSSQALLDGSKPIRGGIPICWPWFGPAPLRVGQGKPSHGFARNQIWRLDGVSEHQDGTLIHMSLSDTPQTRTLWDHAFTLELDVLVGQELKLILTSINQGDMPLTYSGALHTYFQVSAPDNVCVKGIGDSYHNSLNGNHERDQTPFRCEGPVDRIYDQPDVRVVLQDVNRDIELINGNHDSIVVWNPWVEGAKAFADMPDEGYQTLLCAETAITHANGVTIAADEEHSLSATIR